MMPVYWDPTLMNNRVAVMVVLPGAAANVQFSLVGNGVGSSSARVTFDWPHTAYNVHQFFKKDIDAGIMSKVDPLIVALEKELQNHRDSHELAPKCLMELTLPIPVQTAPNTITKWGRTKENGTQILIVKLTAYQSLYTVKNRKPQ